MTRVRVEFESWILLRFSIDAMLDEDFFEREVVLPFLRRHTLRKSQVIVHY